MQNTGSFIHRRSLLACGIAAAAGQLPLAGAANAATETFPARSMRFVVPFPPGSGTDTAARLFAKAVGEIAGQSVIVENKPGGNGFIGVQSVLAAPADGYTVLLGGNSVLSTNAATFKKLPYDPIGDFSLVSLLLDAPVLVVVPPNSPYRTFADLVADAKKRPGALSYGTGSAAYTLYAEWLNQIAQIKSVPINYKGSGDVVTATMSGNVDFSVVDGSTAMTLVKSGRLRALLQPLPKRSPLLPDVPSAAEAGVPAFEAVTWVAAAVSAKTPAAVTQRLAELFAKAGESAEIRKYYENQFLTLRMYGPEEFRKYQRAEIERWKSLVSLVGMEQQ